MRWTHEHAWKLDAPPDTVLAAFTRPEQLTRWFAERVDLHPEPGGRYRFWGRHTLGTPTEAEATQALVALEPDRHLRFTWTLYGTATEVGIGLAPEGEGTQLTLHHALEGPLPTPRPKELIDDHWRLAFGNLAAHLAGGDGILLPDYADPAPEVRLSLMIDAPRADVFRALIEPEAIGRWFDAPAAVVDPRPGGRYQLGWKYEIDGRPVEGGPTRILELVPDRKLVLDWPDWRGDATVTGQTITFDLADEGPGTRLTFVHAGFERAADISDYPFGWRYFLDKFAGVATAGAAG